MSAMLGIPVGFKSILKIRNMAAEMRREAKSKEMIDFTSPKFLGKDYFEVHLEKYVSHRSEGQYDFSCSYEWMPSGTIMEHFSCGHRGRTLLPNEAQMLAILLGITALKLNQKAIQSKRGVCHWYVPIAYKRRDKIPEVGFTVLETWNK